MYKRSVETIIKKPQSFYLKIQHAFIKQENVLTNKLPTQIMLALAICLLIKAWLFSGWNDCSNFIITHTLMFGIYMLNNGLFTTFVKWIANRLRVRTNKSIMIDCLRQIMLEKISHKCEGNNFLVKHQRNTNKELYTVDLWFFF